MNHANFVFVLKFCAGRFPGACNFSGRVQAAFHLLYQPLLGTRELKFVIRGEE